MVRQVNKLGVSTILLCMSSPLWAEDCADRSQIIERLQHQNAEALVGGGMQPSAEGGILVEIWSSDTTGTFTVMLTNAEGVSCVVATGTDWQEVPIAMDGIPG